MGLCAPNRAINVAGASKISAGSIGCWSLILSFSCVNPGILGGECIRRNGEEVVNCEIEDALGEG